MLSERIGSLLRVARRQRNLSRAALARRGGVSVRLVAELERGQRPNVSLESALKLLKIAGVSLVATTRDGAAARMGGAPEAVPPDRDARAARRRQTWTGRQVALREEDNDPRPERSKAKRFASVAHVSRQAFLIAAGEKSGADRRPKRKAVR